MKTQKFQIADNTKAFALLTKNLYKNPLRSAIREVIVNAIDSNRMANSTKPVEITLPSYDFPNVMVKDYGLGMSEDFIKSTYTSFFASTKESNSSATGSFGLGCKAPFAFADKFFIESIKDNKKTKAIAFINDEGTPQLVCEKSTEYIGENYTLITIPFDTDNNNVENIDILSIVLPFGESEYELLNTVRYGKPKSIKDKVLFDDGIRESDWGNLYNKSDCLFITVGDIIYTVDTNELDQRVSATISNMFRRLVFPMTKDSVSILPSREGLIYDNKTKEALGEAFKEVVAELLEKDGIPKKEDFLSTSKEVNPYLKNQSTLASRLLNFVEKRVRTTNFTSFSVYFFAKESTIKKLDDGFLDLLKTLRVLESKFNFIPKTRYTRGKCSLVLEYTASNLFRFFIQNSTRTFLSLTTASFKEVYKVIKYIPETEALKNFFNTFDGYIVNRNLLKPMEEFGVVFPNKITDEKNLFKPVKKEAPVNEEKKVEKKLYYITRYKNEKRFSISSTQFEALSTTGSFKYVEAYQKLEINGVNASVEYFAMALSRFNKDVTYVIVKTEEEKQDVVEILKATRVDTEEIISQAVKTFDEKEFSIFLKVFALYENGSINSYLLTQAGKAVNRHLTYLKEQAIEHDFIGQMEVFSNNFTRYSQMMQYISVRGEFTGVDFILKSLKEYSKKFFKESNLKYFAHNDFSTLPNKDFASLLKFLPKV